MKTPKLLLSIALLASLAGFITSCSAAKPAASDERTADYYFMEAMRQRALERHDLAYVMFRRALELTPDKSGREAYEVGYRTIILADMAGGDSVLFEKGLELAEEYFRAHPEDIYAGSFLAQTNAAKGRYDRALEIYEVLRREKPNNVSIAAGNADILLGVGRFDEATELYRGLEKSMGRNTALTQRLSNIKIWQGDTVGALEEVNSLIEALPRSVEALQLGAAACTQFGRPERALEYVERAKVLDPTNGSTYYYAARAYQALGRSADYEASIIGAINGDDLEETEKIELIRYFLSEEFDPSDSLSTVRCEPLMESLVHQYPHSYRSRMLYTSFLASLNRYESAAEQMSYALDADPSDPKDFLMLARLYASGPDADLKRALEITNRGQKQHPANVELYELKAAILNRSDSYEEAIATLNAALELDSISDSERSSLHSDIANILQETEQADTAAIRTHYERALELEPDNDLAMNNYAYWLSNVGGGDLLLARTLIARAVLYNPGSSTYYDTYAWVCFRLGQLEDAKRYIDMALVYDKSEQEGNPEQMAELLEHAAEIYDSLGQRAKADEYRTRAAQLSTLPTE